MGTPQPSNGDYNMTIHDIALILPFIIFGLLFLILIFTFILIEIEPDPYAKGNEIEKCKQSKSYWEPLREVLRPYRHKMWNAVKVMFAIIAFIMLGFGYLQHEHNKRYHNHQHIKPTTNGYIQHEVDEGSASDVELLQTEANDKGDYSDVNLGEYPPLFCPPSIVGRDNAGNVNPRCNFRKQGI